MNLPTPFTNVRQAVLGEGAKLLRFQLKSEAVCCFHVVTRAPDVFSRERLNCFPLNNNLRNMFQIGRSFLTNSPTAKQGFTIGSDIKRNTRPYAAVQETVQSCFQDREVISRALMR